MWTVTIIESERGWGQRVHEVREFDKFEDAKAFADRFNSANTELTVPDWYMVAHEPVYKQKGK